MKSFKVFRRTETASKTLISFKTTQPYFALLKVEFWRATATCPSLSSSTTIAVASPVAVICLTPYYYLASWNHKLIRQRNLLAYFFLSRWLSWALSRTTQWWAKLPKAKEKPAAEMEKPKDVVRNQTMNRYTAFKWIWLMLILGRRKFLFEKPCNL